MHTNKTCRMYISGQSLYTLTLPFLQFFNGLLSALTLEMYPPNWKSVALPVPEIRAGC